MIVTILKLYSTILTSAALILFPSLLRAQPSSFDNDKPQTSFNTQYHQVFNPQAGWNQEVFYQQWDAMAPNVFTSEDIAAGYLQFQWIMKRLIISRQVFVPAYVMEAELDYGAGSNRGGVVIRANPQHLDQVQEPAQGDPGFNAEGIAFYPTTEGDHMIVQFTGIYEQGNTPVTRILVPKPAGVSSLLHRGTLRIEDHGSTIYTYYNNNPLARIELSGLTGTTYTSGTVYSANLETAGTFSGMEVESIGKVSVAQRNATLRLYRVTINYNALLEQYITFDAIPKKFYNDPPFTVSATSSSGLPVNISLVSGPGTLQNNTVTLTGETGVIVLSAKQSGNHVYYPAPEVRRSVYISDPAFANAEPNSQYYTDNWVVTDALGRTLPYYEEVGPRKDNKTVGVFYFVWHGFHGNRVFDITQILKKYPSDPLSDANPYWGPRNHFHFWGEPEAGYHRAEDPWIIRRDLQMLSNAQVDFIYIDVTNAVTYDMEIRTLCEVSLQMRKEGVYTPYIVFHTNSHSGRIMNYIYDTYYASSLFDELWFMWDGKPLILGNFKDPVLRPEVKEFFTIRYSWAWTNTRAEPHHWQWLDRHPQNFGWSADPAVPEQIPVSVASHPTNTTGTSYSNRSQPPVDEDYLTEFTGQGLHFAEQWERAHSVDPEVIMVTQWNEWLAQRFIREGGSGIYAGRPIKDGDTYFVDVFTQEFNRDMAPMKGGHTDNFYYQLISNIRKFKGMAPPQSFSEPTTMLIDGNFSAWDGIEPVFRDPANDVVHRNFRGYDAETNYVNTTGRNDIVVSKACHDDDNLYFYVETVDNLTPHTDPHWMILLIDVDRNKGTGWEGYDFTVNKEVISDTTTTLKRWNGRLWEVMDTIPMAINGNALELSIPRHLLTLTEGMPELHFKWADNTGPLGDISSFFLYGDVAPDRRFNFNYSMTPPIVKEQLPFKDHQIPGTIQFEDFDLGGAGVSYADATFFNAGGAYRPDEAVDIGEKEEEGYYVGWVNDGEWMEYTVNVNAIGNFLITIHYRASGNDNQAKLYINGTDKTGTVSLPGADNAETWTSIELDVRLTAGKHILRFFVAKASDDLELDKMVFAAKDVVYPGNGTGLWRSFWTGSAGGRNWFVDSICGEIDLTIDHYWGLLSPGCGIGNDFWNARWEGEIQALYSEPYTFYVTVQDQARLWIDNQQLINEWVGASSGQTHSATIHMTAGQKVPFRLDYAKRTGQASIKLEWSSESNPREVVPTSQLYPIATTRVGQVAFEEHAIQVFPNPAIGSFSVDPGILFVNKLTLHDMTGRAVYSDENGFGGTKTINTNGLNSGVYFLTLTGNGFHTTRKIIIQ